ncbi:MAG: hypothetical protein EOP40_14940, partial [Rubrivivax sp.]
MSSRSERPWVRAPASASRAGSEPLMSPHVAVPVHEISQVGEARRLAVQAAQALGFDEVAAGRVALVATELGTNLVRHAQRGQLLIASIEREGGAPAVEMLSLDEGPGMANVSAHMVDGFSTGGTSGSGLGAVRRLSTEFDIFSLMGTGTVVMARVSGKTPPVGSLPEPRGGGELLFTVGAIALAAPGEIVCGDAWAIEQQGQRISAVMADGLGHGPLAMEASQAAVRVFQSDPFGVPSQVVERMHAPLRATRGAAVLMACLDGEQQQLTFSGAGNIAGRVISGVADRSLMTQHGTVGLQLRRLNDTRCDWPLHAIVVLHSDGLTTRWDLDQARGVLQHHP